MKRLLTIIPLVILLCFTFSCQQGEEAAEEPVVDVEADKEAIKKITDDFNAALNAGDIDKLVSLFTDDAVRIPPNKPPLVGKEAIRSSFQEYLDQFTVQSEGVIVDLKVSGDLAFVRGSWTSINTPKTGGEPLRIMAVLFQSSKNSLMGHGKLFVTFLVMKAWFLQHNQKRSNRQN